MSKLNCDELSNLMANSGIDADVSAQVKEVISGTDSISLQKELTDENENEQEKKYEVVAKSQAATNMIAQIQKMSIPQKIKAALFGNQLARNILIREPNKLIALFVLQNPRLGENEIQEFAKNTNLDEAVFRAIGGDAKWMKSYAVKLALVGNPKVPTDLSLKWVKYLRDNELRRFAKSKNIPNSVAVCCKKVLEMRTPKQ